MGKVLMSLEQAREIARTMWEVQGLTMPQIATAMGKSLGAVEKWSRVCNWARKADLRKAGMGSEVRELTRAKFLDSLAEAGMPPEKAAAILVEGMTLPATQETELYKDKDGEVATRIVERKDYKTIHKYLHDYLLGSGAVGGTEKAGPAGGVGGSINIQVNIPDKR